jgi:hypothetical protein
MKGLILSLSKDEAGDSRIWSRGREGAPFLLLRLAQLKA